MEDWCTPASAQYSSSSPAAPLTPTAPSSSLVTLSRITTPPGNGAKAPSVMPTIAIPWNIFAGWSVAYLELNDLDGIIRLLAATALASENLGKEPVGQPSI